MEIDRLDHRPALEGTLSYEQAHSLKTEATWSKLADFSVENAVIVWLETLKPTTRKNYLSGMNRLTELGFVNPGDSLQIFSLRNHNTMVDEIKLVADWSECTKQSRAACYISFTGFLYRRTEGIIKKAIPSREGSSKTFFKVREKVSTNAMNRSQWTSFLSCLRQRSKRDWLTAQMMIQGGKRTSEVVSITIDRLDFARSKIKFLQSKTKGTKKEIIISFPESYMEALSNYLGDREGVVFITRNGKPVQHRHVHRSFVKSGERAKIPFRVTPHVLRASTVTYLKGQGCADSDIMKITGHASAEMVHAYDKSSQEDNISKKISLI